MAAWVHGTEIIGHLIFDIAVPTQMTGVLGILIEAKHQQLITAVKPLLEALITTADFWVSQRLYKRVLEVVGEE